MNRNFITLKLSEMSIFKDLSVFKLDTLDYFLAGFSPSNPEPTAVTNGKSFHRHTMLLDRIRTLMPLPFEIHI